MKSFLGLALLSTSSCGITAAKPMKLYVAQNGNDDWSGKLSEPNDGKTDVPFATVERARDAVREYKKNISQPITVFIRGGTYHLAQPFTLRPEDSGSSDKPITYCAYQDEKVVLSGGVRLAGRI